MLRRELLSAPIREMHSSSRDNFEPRLHQLFHHDRQFSKGRNVGNVIYELFLTRLSFYKLQQGKQVYSSVGT